MSHARAEKVNNLKTSENSHNTKWSSVFRAERHYLSLVAWRVDQALAGHLYGLIGPGKLRLVNQALGSGLAIRVSDADQVGGLREDK